MPSQHSGFDASEEWRIQGAFSWMLGNADWVGKRSETLGLLFAGDLWFIRPEQHPFCLWGTVKAGFFNQFDISKSNMIEQRQEILSRYCPAFSLEPTIYPVFKILWKLIDEHLVGDHQASAGFQYTKNLLYSCVLIWNQINGPVGDHCIKFIVFKR